MLGTLFLLVLAGYDTTAATLSFVMGLLATHPEEQEQLYKELRDVVGDRRVLVCTPIFLFLI
jgi:cytochrome P450